MSRPIDVMQLGMDRIICAWEADGVIVDPGPESRLETLLEALEGEAPRALLLTHIHLDHAGAAGALVRRFPDLEVYVHGRGAPHLVDPEKLVNSATQLYGDEMELLWGEVLPVPEENLRVLTGGETVLGFRVEYTPGHASHHVSYLHEATGEAFVGDVAGVRIPPADFTAPPTPPPDIDLEAWMRSLDLLSEWSPSALCLTHFGRVDDVDAHLLRMREGIARRGENARIHGGEAFMAGVEAEIDAIDEPEVAERFRRAAPTDQMWLGLERYWRKKAERDEAVSAS
ncbi:MAG: MBL fold metallo-hydrolase [Thermoleophilaceae bacterium]|nr:MBL fold metallo-hydrolase [Thermoleophilaceae bacterium]